MDWRDSAACRGLDLAIFFPTGSEVDAPSPAVSRARRICTACPVQQACLGWALKSAIAYGILGGCTERERRQLRAEMRRSRHLSERSSV